MLIVSKQKKLSGVGKFFGKNFEKSWFFFKSSGKNIKSSGKNFKSSGKNFKSSGKTLKMKEYFKVF